MIQMKENALSNLAVTLYLLILQLDVVLLHVAVDLCALVTQLLLQAFYQLPWTQIKRNILSCV